MFSKGLSTDSSCKHHSSWDCSERQFVTEIDPQGCDTNTQVVGTRVRCSFPHTYVVPGSDTKREITWVDAEPILHLQVAHCFLYFSRTELILCIRLFHFVFSAHIHIALPSSRPGRSGVLEGPPPTANPFLPSLAFLPDCGMSFLSASFVIYPTSSSTCTAFPHFCCSLAHSFSLTFFNNPSIPESFNFLILYLSKLLKQGSTEWQTLW